MGFWEGWAGGVRVAGVGLWMSVEVFGVEGMREMYGFVVVVVDFHGWRDCGFR